MQCNALARDVVNIPVLDAQGVEVGAVVEAVVVVGVGHGQNLPPVILKN